MSPKRIKDDDDERRCIGKTPQGEQCHYIAEPGSERCRACGGQKPDDRNDHNDYLAEQFRRRLRIASSDRNPVQLLEDNLMDINAMIAAHRNKMMDESSFLANSSAITDLVMKAEKLTNTLHRLSLTNSMLLARPALVRWAQQIVMAVTDVVRDKYDGWEDDALVMSNAIADITAGTENKEGEKPE